MKKGAVKLCKDCRKPLSQKALRCRECFHKSTKGRSAWNSGHRSGYVICVDCGKKSYHRGKTFNYSSGIKKKWLRCRKCANKYMVKYPPNPNGGKPMYGKDNPNFGKSGIGITNWKGGRIITKQGYIKIRVIEHPHNDNGYVLEHRLVVEKFLGRYLTDKELIHHKNGVRTDNRLENLQIVTRNKHKGLVTCPYCLQEFLIE
jgi:DNA-directed RNA polymerase subunit RPC12/RpoP